MMRRRLALSLVAFGVTALSLTSLSARAFALREHVYSSSFGSQGAAEGQFSEPWGVAVSEVGGSSGDVYVTDASTNRVEVFTATGTFISQFNGNASPTGEFSKPESIAVDNSTNPLDPSAGDVYVADPEHNVIDKFSGSGTYLGHITAGGAGPLAEPVGVAVDPEGTVWVHQAGGEIDSYNNALANEFVSARSVSNLIATPVFAVDSEHNLYVASSPTEVEKLDRSGNLLIRAVDGEFTTAVGVDPSTNSVYLDHVNAVASFDAMGSPGERFGSEHLSGGGGVAVDVASHRVYVADRSAHAVMGFTEIVVPDVSTAAASNLQTEGGATLNGTVNPDGQAVTSCRFEYGETTSYEFTTPCSPNPGSGSAPIDVSANVSGLTPGRAYHYRLAAANSNGENPGKDRFFVALSRPVVSGASVVHLGSTTALIQGQVTPGGALTRYWVEYGPTTSYGSSTTAINAGDGIEAAGVRVQLAGLEPGTRYYARLAAQNELTTTVGSDVTFTSLAATGPSAWSLPDGRAYEMVSPLANARGNVYVPDTGHIPLSHHQTSTRQPLRASADGNAVTYAAAPPESGGNGSVGTYEGNDFLATRGADGWTATDIMPPTGNLSPYRDGGGFSSDLSVAVLRTSDVQLTPDAPLNCEVLYSRTGDGAYHAAFTSTQTPGQCGSPQLAGLSANNSSIVFESEAALTPEAVSGSSEQFFETVNLYDSVAGRVYLVNVLPNGTPVVNAAFGGVSAAGEELREPFLKGSPGYHHYGRVISADGTRIVWTDLNTGNLYVRENPAGPSPSTVQVDASVGGGGQYRGASSDGSKVFFTKSGHLYVYDLKSAATNDLTPAGGVLGVTGVSEDGSYVYLVAESLLASNENANSEQAQGGQPNLYLRANGNTTFVAVLSARDNKWIGPAASGEYYFGDWRSSDKARTAEVAPDGRHLVFMSTRSLTGYDNSGGCSLEGEEAGCPEVFMYDAGTRRIFCASCNPSGEPPGAELRDPEAVGGAFLPSPLSQGTYQLRWMSNDGNRVFFDSSEPLVPQDTNGVQDVYEWERAGTGNCSQETDCIYLISSNLGSEDAFLVDASASGNDVFFTTRAQLVPADRNENVDLYDARVEGGFAQAASACSGSGCQGTPSVSPTFPTPSTASFEGSGNFPSPPVAKPLTRQKLKNALRRCRQVPMKRRRARCEARARRRYGAKSSATRRLHRRGTKK